MVVPPGHADECDPEWRWRQVARPDATIHYVDSGGAGAPVVLLHGLAGHAGEWRGTMRHLAPRWRALALDQRGHGRGTRRPDDLSRDAFAADIAAVIEDAGLAQPVVLIGQSMGAHSALIAAARYPHLVSRLVMAESDVGGGGAEPLAKLGDALAAWPIPFPDYERAMRFFGGDNELGRAWADGFAQRVDGLWPRWDLDVMLRIMEPVFAHENWAEWEALSQPALLVLGEHGSIDADQIERMMEKRPGTRRVVIPNAGHDLHLEQPQAWYKALDDFLD